MEFGFYNAIYCVQLWSICLLLLTRDLPAKFLVICTAKYEVITTEIVICGAESSYNFYNFKKVCKNSAFVQYYSNCLLYAYNDTTSRASLYYYT